MDPKKQQLARLRAVARAAGFRHVEDDERDQHMDERSQFEEEEKKKPSSFSRLKSVLGLN